MGSLVAPAFFDGGPVRAVYPSRKPSGGQQLPKHSPTRCFRVCFRAFFRRDEAAACAAPGCSSADRGPVAAQPRFPYSGGGPRRPTVIRVVFLDHLDRELSSTPPPGRLGAGLVEPCRVGALAATDVGRSGSGFWDVLERTAGVTHRTPCRVRSPRITWRGARPGSGGLRIPLRSSRASPGWLPNSDGPPGRAACLGYRQTRSPESNSGGVGGRPSCHVFSLHVVPPAADALLSYRGVGSGSGNHVVLSGRPALAPPSTRLPRRSARLREAAERLLDAAEALADDFRGRVALAIRPSSCRGRTRSATLALAIRRGADGGRARERKKKRGLPRF